jgi:hypothetical protein
MKRSFTKTAFVLLILSCLQNGFAQLPRHLSEKAQISLLTIYPGKELYATFGHSAIRVVDPEYQIDRLYNYDTFDFEEPGFYLKFARGQLDYFLSAYSYEFAEYLYREERRPIIEQVLNLSLPMKDKIFRFLEWNYLPENRGYRYDFFFDNCATRIRDVFIKNLGDSLQLYLNDERQLSFRQYIDLYLDNHPFSDFGMDLGLGTEADRIATAWEAMFLPDYLYESFSGGIITIDGQKMPFVAQMDTLLWVERADAPSFAFPWADIIIWGLLVLVASVTVFSYRKKGNPSLKYRGIDTVLFGVTGLAGIMILFLWFGTDHKVTPDNWNLLWAWPMHVIIFFFLFSTKKRSWLFWYFAANSAVMLIVWLGWAFWPQSFHSATFPLVMILGVRGGWLAYRLKTG